MKVGLSAVSKLIILEGSITLDGVEHIGEIDCRELTGDHDLTVNGSYDFRAMTPADHEYVKKKLVTEKDSEILNLQAEVVELEYQKALEVMKNV